MNEFLKEEPDFVRIIAASISIPLWIGIGLGIYFIIKKRRKKKTLTER